MFFLVITVEIRDGPRIFKPKCSSDLVAFTPVSFSFIPLFYIVPLVEVVQMMSFRLGIIFPSLSNIKFDTIATINW